jgi:nitrogen regulatory protein PII-like uncharacterized protein
MKTLVKIFVDHEHLVRLINILTELGITGFYLIEYHGMAPKTWKSFKLSEHPDLALEAIRNQSEPGVIVNTVVNSEKFDKIIKKLEESLRGVRYTVMGHKVTAIMVRGD